jgi:hypothetical protein
MHELLRKIHKNRLLPIAGKNHDAAQQIIDRREHSIQIIKAILCDTKRKDFL